MSFGDLKTDAGLKALNGFLSTKSYIEGYKASQADVTTFNALAGAPDSKKYAHASRWYKHIASFSDERRARMCGSCGTCPAGAKAAAKPAAAKPAAAAKAAPKPADDDDDFDPFAESTPEEEAAAKALAEKKKAEAAAKKKAPVVGKSLVLLDIKPWEAEQDLEALAVKVKSIAMEGLDWKQQHKLIPIAFGVKKLQVGCVVVDDLVGVDDLIDRIQNDYADDVQSIDIFSFGKI